MRLGYQDSGFYGESLEKLASIGLGWDHAAEHEWGIKGLRAKFKTNDKKMGFEAYKIGENTLQSFELPQSGDLSCAVLVLTSQDFSDSSAEDKVRHVLNYMSRCPQGLEETDLKFKYWPLWDGDNFALIMEDTPNSRLVYNMFITAFRKKDIAFHLGGQINPFAGTGLFITMYSRIPKEVIQNSLKQAKESQDMDKLMKSNPAYIRLHVLQDQWKKDHPNAATPWDYIFLGNPRFNNEGKLSLWLNPNHQDHLNANWIDEQDIQDWCDGKVGAVIKSEALWDELCNAECKNANLSSISYRLKHFRGVTRSHLLTPNDVYCPDGEIMQRGTGFPRKMQVRDPVTGMKRLTEEMINAVEAYIKWEYYRDFRDQIQYRGVKVTEYFNATRETQEVVWGFFQALKAFGLETCPGACNTPAVRENFSWWSNLLESEAKWELLQEYRVTYEPWVKNGFTEVDRCDYIDYVKRDRDNDWYGSDTSRAFESAKFKSIDLSILEETK